MNPKGTLFSEVFIYIHFRDLPRTVGILMVSSWLKKEKHLISSMYNSACNTYNIWWHSSKFTFLFTIYTHSNLGCYVRSPECTGIWKSVDLEDHLSDASLLNWDGYNPWSETLYGNQSIQWISIHLTWNILERQVCYFFRQLYPKTSNYCLKNRALGFPGIYHIEKNIYNIRYYKIGCRCRFVFFLSFRSSPSSEMFGPKDQTKKLITRCLEDPKHFRINLPSRLNEDRVVEQNPDVRPEFLVGAPGDFWRWFLSTWAQVPSNFQLIDRAEKNCWNYTCTWLGLVHHCIS